MAIYEKYSGDRCSTIRYIAIKQNIDIFDTSKHHRNRPVEFGTHMMLVRYRYIPPTFANLRELCNADGR